MMFLTAKEDHGPLKTGTDGETDGRTGKFD